MEKEDRAEPEEELSEEETKKEEKEEAPADTVDETREDTEEDMTSENVIITGASNTPDEYTTYHIHIVKEGETIETICTMYNSNLSLLNDYNDLSEVSKGMKIIIPENDES
ncbi:TPA: LysM peptidoglycan-binding domain-containing protein, partial [Candidatus Ventrenecus stercoripullorum]|nr:LysM peptidoglycan-binding domain-containing protein [Candidatus Ventrenecus stercoripullorum]